MESASNYALTSRHSPLVGKALRPCWATLYRIERAAVNSTGSLGTQTN